ncbi:MAG: YwaF family protein [Clostridia bacterium]|nr:YwaF family protein [Clostridia bacterium]
MNAFERFLLALKKTMEVPKPFGAFHIWTLEIMVVATVLLCVFFRNTSDRKFRLILFLFWVVLVLLEVLKQLRSSFRIEGEAPYWKYLWSAFPFQFCDSPFYILPLVFLLKEGKVRDAAMVFLASYAFFAGALVVIAVPESVFCDTLIGNVHTMFHHGTQVALGIFIAVYNRNRFTLRTFFSAIPIFLIMIAIAQSANFIAHKYIPDEYFNLYYISPFFNRNYPFFGPVGEKYHWTLITFVYVIGFTGIAFLMHAAQRGILSLFGRKKTKKA